MDAKALLAGSFVAQHVNTRQLSVVAGAAFIVIGLWTPWSALRG
jgi:putative Ca2+/H+ antiporter (TMEM165/GDT1 family)